MENNIIQRLIKEKVVTNRVGLEVLLLGNAMLDFNSEFIFLGFTKTGKLKLGKTHSSGPSKDDYKWNNKYAKIDIEDNEIHISVDESRYHKYITIESD